MSIEAATSIRICRYLSKEKAETRMTPRMLSPEPKPTPETKTKTQTKDRDVNVNAGVNKLDLVRY
jgi:hypothetical protein